MYSNDDSTLSKTITFLRFPLIVAVVFIHTDLFNATAGGASPVNEGLFPMYSLLRHVISEELARIAVPLFFFVSGFLFFYRSEFSLKTYGQKLKKRVRTLLIPYIFWNMADFLWIHLSQLFLNRLPIGGGENTSW